MNEFCPSISRHRLGDKVEARGAMRTTSIPLRPRHRLFRGEGGAGPRLEDRQRRPLELVVHNVALFGRPLLTNILASAEAWLPAVCRSKRISQQRNGARPFDRQLGGPRPSLPVFRRLTVGSANESRTRLVTSLRTSSSGLGVMGRPQLLCMRLPLGRSLRTMPFFSQQMR